MKQEPCVYPDPPKKALNRSAGTHAHQPLSDLGTLPIPGRINTYNNALKEYEKKTNKVTWVLL